MKRLLAILLTLTTLGCLGLSGCKKRQAIGKFYTLQEACEQGFLTEEDVKAIAFYHGGREANVDKFEEDYAPTPKNPAQIPAKIQNNIKSDYIFYFLKESKKAKESMIKIEKYYGYYNGCYVVVIDHSVPGYGHNEGIMTVEIMGYKFTYNWKGIEVWRK